MPLERFDRLIEKYEPRGGMSGWGCGRASPPGLRRRDTSLAARRPLAALRAMARGDWQAAAD